MPINKLKNGKYLVRINMKIATGVYKRLNKTVDSYSEARKTEKLLKGKAKQDDTINFCVMLDGYLEDIKRRYRPRTYLCISSTINKQIRSYFQEYRICDITPQSIHQWQVERSQSVASNRYLFNIECMLFSIFKYAIAFFHLKNNPCKSIHHMGRNKSIEMNFWDVDEFKKVLRQLDMKSFSDRKYQLILLISFFCGTRIGETLALTRDDIDYEQCAITINKTFVKMNGSEYVQTPKTPSSIRTIAIPIFLKEKIEEYLIQIPNSQTRLFSNVTSKAANEKLHVLAKKAGVKQIRFHDLRHSAVSYWLHLGIPIYDVSKRCGHTSPRVTYRVYSHMYPSDEKAPDILEKAAKGEKLT